MIEVYGPGGGDTHMNRACNSTFFGPRPLGLLEGVKRSKSLNFNYLKFQRFFMPTFVCVLTNKRYKTYQTGSSFCRLGHAPGGGKGGACGQKFIFFQHGHVAYQIEKDVK